MRYKISIIVEPEPGTELIGVKEDIAVYCEKFGDIKDVQTAELEPEQMKIKL